MTGRKENGIKHCYRADKGNMLLEPSLKALFIKFTKWPCHPIRFKGLDHQHGCLLLPGLVELAAGGDAYLVGRWGTFSPRTAPASNSRHPTQSSILLSHTPVGRPNQFSAESNSSKRTTPKDLVIHAL